jgi:beta-glucanase (GH16 family)
VAALSSPALPERVRRRRRLAAAALATTAFALLAVSAALPSFAATSAKKSASAATTALSTTVTKKLAAPGAYTVVVTVVGPATAETVSVSVGSSTQRNVSLTPGESTALAFYPHFNRRSFEVHAVASAAAVHLQVAASRRSAQTTPKVIPAAPIGSSGALGVSGSPGVFYTAPAKGPYTHLVWSDEFNGPAGTPPNPAVWTPDLGGDCGSGTLSTDTTDPANASLDGSGDMGINAFTNATTPGAPSYTAAQLDTNHKLSFSYGELEARILLPTGSGLCSGFWMVGNSPNGGCFPQCGEIDVMEAVTKFPDSVTGTLHGPVSGSSNYQQFQSAVNAPTPFTGAFHTYGVIWQPGRITWTLDGVPYGTATPSQLPPSAQWVFDGDPFHLLLSLDVGGWIGPPAAGATFPATMRVDWVRVYD